MTLQDKMFAMVQAWQERGMVRREFLSGKAVSLAKFDYWLCKYRKSQQLPQKNIPAQVAQQDFKSFVLSDNPSEACRKSVSMEITTPSGMRITIYN